MAPIAIVPQGRIDANFANSENGENCENEKTDGERRAVRSLARMW